jgi:hypothetical protein
MLPAHRKSREWFSGKVFEQCLLFSLRYELGRILEASDHAAILSLRSNHRPPIGFTPFTAGNNPRPAKSSRRSSAWLGESSAAILASTGNASALAKSSARGSGISRYDAGSTGNRRISKGQDHAPIRHRFVRSSPCHVDPFAPRLLIDDGYFFDRFGPLPFRDFIASWHVADAFMSDAIEAGYKPHELPALLTP